MRPYGRVLLAAGVPRLLVANLLSAAGIGAMPVSILLGLQARYGTLGPAGSSAGLFGLGNAVGLLVQGRLLDRFDQRRIVAVAAVACTSVLLLILVSVNTSRVSLSWPAIAGGFFLAGLLLPGVTAAVRSRLAAHADLSEVRLAGYSLLSVTFQAGMAVGPLLVSAIVLVFGAEHALLLPAVEIAAAAACFVTAGHADVGGYSQPGDGSGHDEGPGTARRGVGGHGSKAGLTALGITALATGAAGGMTAVGIPAVAITSGHPASSGIQFAAIAIGDLLGGIHYGSRPASPRLGRHLLTAQAAALIIAIGVIGAAQSPIALTLTLLAGAIVGAPAGIATSALLDSVSARDRIAAAYTLIVSVGLIGSAIASALAGNLADHAGSRAPFIAAPACLLIGLTSCALWLANRRHADDQ